MANYRKILELVLAGRSYSGIVEVAGCSPRDVSRVKKVIEERGVTAATVVNEENLALWFPDGRRMVSAAYEQPDLAAVLRAMRAQRHFTLLMAWRRYADAKTPGKKYGYAQFCVLFADYVRRNDLVATRTTSPGGRCWQRGPGLGHRLVAEPFAGQHGDDLRLLGLGQRVRRSRSRWLRRRSVEQRLLGPVVAATGSPEQVARLLGHGVLGEFVHGRMDHRRGGFGVPCSRKASPRARVLFPRCPTQPWSWPARPRPSPLGCGAARSPGPADRGTWDPERWWRRLQRPCATR